MSRLKEIILSITNRCNSKCRMCDIPLNKMEELSISGWKRAIKDASLVGAETIVFSGGEPLLREDIFELISFVKNNYLRACLTSNGLLLNDEVCNKLSKSGVAVVNISVEGPEEDHDYLRGENTFKRALSALENLKSHNIESTIATMVSRYNYQHLPFIIGLAKDYGATTVRFQPFNRIFIEDAEREKDFLIEAKDRKGLNLIIEEVIELCARYNIATNPTNYLRKLSLYLSGEQVFPQGGCSALWSSCPVNAKGDVFPCWVITDKDKILGNVAEDGLFRLWTSKRRSKMLKTIFEDGCPGCMMSCYDKVFGQDELKKFLSEKAGKISNIRAYGRFVNRAVQFIKRGTLRLKLRYNYYKSYHGSFGKVFARIFKNARRRREAGRINNRNDIEKSIEDITFLKERLKKELARYR